MQVIHRCGKTTEEKYASTPSKPRWRKHCKDCQHLRHIDWKTKNVNKRRAAQMISRVKSLTNVIVDWSWLTHSNLISLLESSTHCKCCGREFNQTLGNGKQNSSPSLDRLIPFKGYVQSNCHLICYRCNTLKSNATPTELACIYKYMCFT